MLARLVRGSLSVGVAEIDGEHEEFAHLSERLIEAVSARRMAEVTAISARLVAHAFTHFSNEERVLVRIGYSLHDKSAFSAHVDEHNRIKPVIVDLLRRPMFDVSDALAIQVLLADHLVKWDMRYKSYSQMAGVEHAAEHRRSVHG